MTPTGAERFAEMQATLARRIEGRRRRRAAQWAELAELADDVADTIEAGAALPGWSEDDRRRSRQQAAELRELTATARARRDEIEGRGVA